MNASTDIVLLHEYSSNHRAAILAARTAGCFYCFETYESFLITKWTDNGMTAICPKCGIDAVLPATVGISPATLQAMHDYWFARFR